MDSTEYPPVVTERSPLVIRGGISPWGILTGIVTALGAMVLLGAIVGAILTRTGTTTSTLRFGTDTWSIVGAIAFFLAEFFAYMWGGYTAGRMARGAGIANGVLVPIGTMVLVAIVGGIVTAIGAHTDMTTWRSTHLAIGNGAQLRVGIGFGILTLVLMLAGGMIGGMRGALWHERLEDVSVAHPRARIVA